MLNDRKALWGRKFGGQAGKEMMRARGRERNPGEMNKLEKKFEKTLLEGLLLETIAWYGYDVVKLRLADNCFLNVDFFVMANSTKLLGSDIEVFPGELVAIDTKGGLIEEDAKIKMRVSTSAFPWRFFYAQARAVKDGGGWKYTEI